MEEASLLGENVCSLDFIGEATSIIKIVFKLIFRLSEYVVNVHTNEYIHTFT